ncbi:MAG: glycosyltransferase family 39 protein [Chitinophagaceae bacterium]|nr:glycosyltransferase family 39 protein [Chitinophagaceae bacterium]
MAKGKPYWPLITLLASVKFVLPFLFIAPEFELQRDEFLYYQQGLHLDFGYLENPPLLSYLATISRFLGGTEFSVKFWPALIGAATLIIACLMCAEFEGKRFAQFLTGIGIITGAFLRIHALFQPNILDIFFWSLSVYFLLCYLKTFNQKFLYSFAIALALGFWSKYSIMFLMMALALGILLTSNRRLFLKSSTYKALTVTVILIVPNLWWQYKHNFPLIHHMQELQQTQLQFLNPLDFLKDQLLFLLPVVFIWIAGLIWLFRQKTFRVFAWAYVFVIILLLFGRGKSYYSMGIYPVLIAAGATVWEKISTKQWLRYVIVIFILIVTIAFAPLLLPLWQPAKLASFYHRTGVAKTGLLKWEDQRDHLLPQDFADMLGWKELTQKTEAIYDGLPDSVKSNTLIYCRNYGQAGALKFYGKDPRFRAVTISDNGSFLLWIPDKLLFKYLFFIGRRFPEKDDKVFQHFKKVTFIDSVKNVYSRQNGDKIFFFQDIDSAGLQLAQSGVQELKAEFKR